MSVSLARDLWATGISRGELSRLARSGQLVRVRRGAYAADAPDGDVARHRQLIAATWPLLEPGSVLSHASAAVLHGLPSWTELLSRVSVIRRSPGHGSRRTNLHVRLAQLADCEVTSMDAYLVCTLERTASDLACVLRFGRAVAVLDAALHAKADAELLATAVAAAAGRRGAGTARAALAVADGRAESVAESISRVRMIEAGILAPQLQVNVFDADGQWVARSDFGWLAHGVLGEFDGRVKYLGGAEEVAQVVMREKAREDRIRELGWILVRWGWADLADLEAFRKRIVSAFAQANPSRVRGSAAPA